MFKKQGRASVLNVEPCSKPQCDQEAGVREPRLCGSAVVSVGAVLKCSQRRCLWGAEGRGAVCAPFSRSSVLVGVWRLALGPLVPDCSAWRCSSCLLLAFALDPDAPSVSEDSLPGLPVPRVDHGLPSQCAHPLFWELKLRNPFVPDCHGFPSPTVIALRWHPAGCRTHSRGSKVLAGWLVRRGKQSPTLNAVWTPACVL